MTTIKAPTSRARAATRKPMPSTSASQATAVLETKVDALIRQGDDNAETLRSLTRAVTTLAVIEDRQTADRKAIDRVFDEMRTLGDRMSSMDRTLDDRIKILENKSPVNDLSNGLVGKVVWGVIAAVLAAGMAVVLRPQSSPAPQSFVIQSPQPAPQIAPAPATPRPQQ